MGQRGLGLSKFQEGASFPLALLEYKKTIEWPCCAPDPAGELVLALAGRGLASLSPKLHRLSVL